MQKRSGKIALIKAGCHMGMDGLRERYLHERYLDLIESLLVLLS